MSIVIQLKLMTASKFDLIKISMICWLILALMPHMLVCDDSNRKNKAGLLITCLMNDFIISNILLNWEVNYCSLISF